MKTKYRIYLNVAKDEKGRLLGFFGYNPEHPLQFAYEGTIDCDMDSQYTACEELFRIFNIEHPRDYHFRSLSVGDVITLGDINLENPDTGQGNLDTFVVRPSGFTRIVTPPALLPPELLNSLVENLQRILRFTRHPLFHAQSELPLWGRTIEDTSNLLWKSGRSSQ